MRPCARDADGRATPIRWRSLGVLWSRELLSRSGWRRLGRAAWRSVVTGSAVIGLFTLALLGTSATLMLRNDPMGLWLLLFTPIASSLLFVVLRSVAASGPLWQQLGDAAARAVLARCQCPRCGYDLAGQTPSDGRVRCTECGTPWKAEWVGGHPDPGTEVVVVGRATSDER